MTRSPVSRPVRFELVAFESLSNRALYDLLRLRADVFVVEQNCAYQDLDGKDLLAIHVLAYAPDDSGRESLVACARVLPGGVSYAEPSIGRVANARTVRGIGVGRALMNEAIACAEKTYPDQGIRISAQQYLERFYASLGFETVSGSYLEDGIPHVQMFRRSESASS